MTEDDLVNEDFENDQRPWSTGVDQGPVDDYAPVQEVLSEFGITFEQ